MDDEALLEHLLAAYERANTSGETALQLGVSYSARNKMFGVEVDGVSHLLSAHYVTDLTEGGDGMVEDIKKWARGGGME